jgi:hypothetical protein
MEGQKKEDKTPKKKNIKKGAKSSKKNMKKI